MPISAAQLYSIRTHTQNAADLARSCQRLKTDGWPAVQVSAIGPIPPQDVRSILADNGLACVSTHISYENMSDPAAIVATHRTLGCTHTALASLPKEMRGAEGYTQLAREASEFARILKAEGIGFGYHNHSFDLERFATSTGSRSGLQILLEDGDVLLGLELDTYWVQHGGADPADWVRKAAGRVPVIHLKDMIVVTPEGRAEQRFAPVGTGNLNWPSLLAACKEAGVESYVVEQDDSYGEDPFDCLKASLESLKRWGLA